MRVTHVALWARDLDAVCAFYEQLGASRGELYTNPRTGFTSRFLSWPRSDVRLEVMHRADMEESRDAGLGWAHVALAVGTEQDVDRWAQELGEHLRSGPRRTGDGYYECVLEDPEGNLVELTADP
jgi:lactoylglutathione lyase